MKCYVFAYGTLLDAKVRKDVIGYETTAYPATLKGYSLDRVVIDQVSYPALVVDNTTNNRVQGEIFEIEQNDLILLDRYETKSYQRILVSLESGLKAWTYIK